MASPDRCLLVAGELTEPLIVLQAAVRTPPVADPVEAAARLLDPRVTTLILDLGLPGVDRPALGRALGADEVVGPTDTLEAVERRHIARVLRHTGGNRRRSAALLGISRSTLLNKIRRYRLDDAPASEE